MFSNKIWTFGPGIEARGFHSTTGS